MTSSKYCFRKSVTTSPRSVGNNFDFSAPVFSCSVICCYFIFCKYQNPEISFHTFLISFFHITSFKNSRNSRCIGRRPADTSSSSFFTSEASVYLGAGRVNVRLLSFPSSASSCPTANGGSMLFIFSHPSSSSSLSFHIYFQKPIKFQHFTLCSKFFIIGADTDFSSGFFQFRICHL